MLIALANLLAAPDSHSTHLPPVAFIMAGLTDAQMQQFMAAQQAQTREQVLYQVHTQARRASGGGICGGCCYARRSPSSCCFSFAVLCARCYQFNAGTMEMKGKTVTADPRKGKVIISSQWQRETGAQPTHS